MYMVRTGQTMSYIKDAVMPISQDRTRRRPRSANITKYAVLRTQIKIGETAFCVAGSVRVSEKDWLYWDF